MTKFERLNTSDKNSRLRLLMRSLGRYGLESVWINQGR